VFDYENLLVIEVLVDLNLKKLRFGWFERVFREFIWEM